MMYGLALLILNVKIVTSDDIYFDLSQIEPTGRHVETVLENYSNFKKRAYDFGDYSDTIESEFGTFVTDHPKKQTTTPPSPTRGLNDYKKRPKFKTATIKRKQNTKKVVKSPKNPKRRNVANTTNNKLNEIFRKYTNRVNRRNKTRNGEALKGKFLDEHLGAFKNKTISIANKFFSLFTIIQFPNSQCQATSASSTYEGTCYHRSECERLNGTAIGDCANGYGVCCVFRNTCGESSNQNCTYFESPGYPNYNPPDGSVVPPTIAPTLPPDSTPDPRFKDPVYYNSHHYRREGRQSDPISTSLTCVFMVTKTSENVQQMRIDFIDLELKGPTNGTCVDERLIITGQNVNDAIPPICGYNSGQHVYVDVGNLQGPLQISVLANQVDRKRYKMRICQLSSQCAGNMNCLQYHTGVTGTISTFNYDQSAILPRSRPGYFNNLNYAICIRKEAGFCSITYTNVQNRTEYPFELVNVDNMGQTLIPLGQAGAEIYNCPEDYIIIDGVRLCGYKLNDGSLITDFTMNAPVTDTSGGPIIIPVRTDANVTGRGFKLFYTQNRCPP